MQTKQRLVRNIKETTLQRLDEIYAEKGYSSCNDLICDILDQYVADSDHFIINNLPPIVCSMVSQEINKATATSDEVIRDIYQVLLHLVRATQKLENFLFPELSKIETDELETEQLLAILDSIDGTNDNK